jgi:hypothetical protein
MVVLFIDPFNLLNNNIFVNKDFKKTVSPHLNERLWKSIEYKQNPIDKILLGDSRTRNMDTDYINKVSGEVYYNFGFGGGTLPEIIDTFWFADKCIKLKKVYIGLNFNIFNATYNRNIFKDSIEIVNNYGAYLNDRNVAKALSVIIYNSIFPNPKNIDKPTETKVEFWASSLRTQDFQYSQYVYPVDYINELKKIVSYCANNNIKLTIITYPNHVDLQNKVKVHNLKKYFDNYFQTITSIATVYHFDYHNNFTSNADNFSDPYHFNDSHQVVDEVWGNKLKYAIIYNDQSIKK